MNVINLQHLYDAAKANHEKERQENATRRQMASYLHVPKQVMLADESEDEDTDLLEAIDAEDESEEEETLPPVTANAPDFVARLQQQLGEIGGAKEAGPVVARHLKQTSNCPDCQSVLQSVVLFPLHLPEVLRGCGIVRKGFHQKLSPT